MAFDHTRLPIVHLRPLGHLSRASFGERGIRTLGNAKHYTGFRVRLLRPLGHLSKAYETKRIRTSDPQFRKLMLYPAELWSHHRRGGESNPRTRGCQVNSLAGSPIRPLSHLSNSNMAEREGFEPPVTCATAAFKAATLNHSDISPNVSGNNQSTLDYLDCRTLCQFVYRYITL